MFARAFYNIYGTRYNSSSETSETLKFFSSHRGLGLLAAFALERSSFVFAATSDVSVIISSNRFVPSVML